MFNHVLLELILLVEWTDLCIGRAYASSANIFALIFAKIFKMFQGYVHEALTCFYDFSISLKIVHKVIKGVIYYHIFKTD